MVSLAVLAGCATVPTGNSLVPERVFVTRENPESIRTQVTGGKEPDAWTGYHASNSSFKGALDETLRQSRIFSEAGDDDAAEYRLEVTIVEEKQPLVGLDMTVTLKTIWKLKRRNDPKVIWQQEITGQFTAKIGEYIIGAVRLQAATEGAVRTVIADGAKLLSALKLK